MDAGIALLDEKIDGAHPSLIQHTLIHLLASVGWLHSNVEKDVVGMSDFWKSDCRYQEYIPQTQWQQLENSKNVWRHAHA